MAAVLVTASFFLMGCERGDAVDESPRPSAEAPAPAPERLAMDDGEAPTGTLPDDGRAASGSQGSDRPSGDPDAPTSNRPSGSAGSGSTPSPTGSPSTTASPASGVDDAGRPGAAPAELAAGAAASGSPEEVLRATSRAYEGLRSFRAGFEQTLQNTILGRTTTSAGTLYQRQPDLFLMEFSDPPEDLIVSDGDFFWMYFPSVDQRQVLRTPRGGQGLDLRAQFVGDPLRRFESTYHGTEAVRGRQAHVMTLVPRESLGYERLKVWIDAEDHLVRRFSLTEGNGIIRHFVLRDMVRNPTLPDDLFAFTPPPGTQVVTR